MAVQSTEQPRRSGEQPEPHAHVRPHTQQLLAGASSTLLVGLLYLALPENLSVGPRWLILVIVAALLSPSLAEMLIHRRRLPLRLAKRLAQAQVVVATLALVGSLGRLLTLRRG